ncbi:hypothetical protein [Salinisphaera sp. T5B8]|uniref:hypothetical protein n=1 Tax=Salinisphaera sp. T5B8 TaxID=1304154 RepID=UPI0033427D36
MFRLIRVSWRSFADNLPARDLPAAFYGDYPDLLIWPGRAIDGIGALALAAFAVRQRPQIDTDHADQRQAIPVV